MGVCTGCSAEMADEQLKDGLCPNCAGGATDAPAADPEAPADAPAPEAPAEGGDAPAM